LSEHGPFACAQGKHEWLWGENLPATVRGRYTGRPASESGRYKHRSARLRLLTDLKIGHYRIDP